MKNKVKKQYLREIPERLSQPLLEKYKSTLVFSGGDIHITSVDGLAR
jgi:hypothetical protein